MAMQTVQPNRLDCATISMGSIGTKPLTLMIAQMKNSTSSTRPPAWLTMRSLLSRPVTLSRALCPCFQSLLHSTLSRKSHRRSLGHAWQTHPSSFRHSVSHGFCLQICEICKNEPRRSIRPGTNRLSTLASCSAGVACAKSTAAMTFEPKYDHRARRAGQQ